MLDQLVCAKDVHFIQTCPSLPCRPCQNVLEKYGVARSCKTLGKAGQEEANEEKIRWKSQRKIIRKRGTQRMTRGDLSTKFQFIT